MIDAFKTNGSSPPVDIQVENHGTLFLLHPLTPTAQAWVDDHLPEDATWFCGAVVVERRFIGPDRRRRDRRRPGGAVMARLCLKTEVWIVCAQIDAGELPAFDENLAAWFEQEYTWPALYADEGGQG